MATIRDLKEFLLEAELDHYFNAFKNELKIATVPQIKYVAESDLLAIGMTKPEMRRLKKFFKKECPQGKLEKIKRALLDKTHISSPSAHTLSLPPDNRISRPISYIRPISKQIISSLMIEIHKTLGEGAFGIVQQGVWTTEEGEKLQVALKCLSRDRLENGTQEFLKEAGLMQTIDHENIVRMYGVVLDRENTLMLVTELAPMRSLLECLKDQMMQQDFPLPSLCDFAQQICDGMRYLESKRLIHRDLAARNILVFTKTKIKISDFGLSRALGQGKDYYQSNFSVNLKLPIAWCAPESINYLKFTSASDVWAYGVTLWELFTYGCQPWAGKNGQQILDAIDEPNHQRLPQPELCTKNYYDLMLKCWDHNPEHRPTFSEMFVLLPQMRPTQVKTVKDFPEVTVPKDYLYYRAYEVIVVLDKVPPNPPAPGLWKGVTMSGKIGYFDPCNTVPFIEPKSSPEAHTPKKSISRKDSKRSGSKKIRPDMISRPQNDLRHTGHIGYDGAIFGDVGFIGDNYDKLPIKTASIGKLDSSRNSITLSESPCRDSQLSKSDTSLNGRPKTNGFGRSWISVDSLESNTPDHADNRTDSGDTDYHAIDDDSLFADFKMPDLSTSFDFDGSFMDEVLKALNVKESLLESANGSSTSPLKEDQFKGYGNTSMSVSPPLEVRSPPPPLPSLPPRIEPKPSNRSDVHKLQAKVKPMSTSDERMMEDAINMANEFASRSGQAEMVRQDSRSSEKHSDSETVPDSPTLMSRLKASIKGSPKHERKRTFSDTLNLEMQDDVPPEAQEAYNLLVVRGSVKETIGDVKRESLISNGSGGHNFAFADSSSSSSSQTPERTSPTKHMTRHLSELSDRTSPPKSVSKHSSERSSVSPPNLSKFSVKGTPDRPVPKPRPEAPTPIKRSEIPVPKPRAEVVCMEPTVQPVEQTLQPVSPQLQRYADSYDSASLNVFNNPLVINEDDWKNSQECNINSQNLQEEKIDIFNSSSESGRRSTSPSDASQSSASKFSFFDEEIADPSPREIMNKLARESRLRRSLDHQRGVTAESEIAPNRNLREPQGIPGKSFTTTSADDEEIDTNPLRMLRGGVIPVRGGRGGSGMSSNKCILQHPKLEFSPGRHLQHSMSVDDERGRNPAFVPADISEEVDLDISPIPALPPRFFGICDSSAFSNPLPLPPRNPRRSVSLNMKPRERKYPLLLADNTNSNISAPDKVTGISRSMSKSVTDNDRTFTDFFDTCETRISNLAFKDIISTNQKYLKPFPLPEYVSGAFSQLDETDSISLADMPWAPPPPTTMPVESTELDCSDIDDVFDSPVSDNFSGAKSVNLSSEGGSSGAATFPRGFKIFGIKSVKCNLEQLGFYNHMDPFWIKSVIIGDERSHSEQSETTESEASPLMLANYKCTEGVSYEDLLDFALDRQKNGEEIELMQKLFGADVTREDCIEALTDTKWDLHKAIKYLKLKQLLSIQLGDVSQCKEALLACDWNVQKAADFMLNRDGQGRTSPECVDV